MVILDPEIDPTILQAQESTKYVVPGLGITANSIGSLNKVSLHTVRTFQRPL